MQHRRAPHAFGGVCFLIKNSVTRDYNLEIFDKIYDGVFGIKLTCTDMSIIIFVCYLPPDNSPYGKDVDGFFSHLTAQLHLASDADLIFICGDMNARVGEQNDLLTDQIEDAIYNTLLGPVTQEVMNTSVYVPLDSIKSSFETNLPYGGPCFSK